MRLFLALCLVCLIGFGCSEDTVSPQPGPTEGTNVGDLAPAFTLPDKDKRDIRLKDYRGKVVMLVFWRSQCQTCTDEMRYVETLWNEHRDDDLVVIGISGDEFEVHWKEYINSTETQSGYPRDWVQVWNKLWDVAGKYKVSGTPHRYLIDREGRIVDNFLTYDEMEAKVEAELAKQ